MVRRICAVAVTALAIVLTSTVAASAREVPVQDVRHDVWRTNPESKAPAIRNGDVVRTVFRHGPRNVVVHSKYADLRRTGVYAQYTVRIESGSHRYREVLVETSRRSWHGKNRTFDRRGNRVTCRVTHRISYATNTVRIQVPRTCLNTPRYVRGTAANYWANRAGTIFTDNPHNERATVRGWTRWIAAN